MSAMNIFKTANAVHLWTDGAFYDLKGTLLATGQKVAVDAALPAVVASQGLTAIQPLLVEWMRSHCTSFDDLLDNAVDAARELVPAAAKVTEQQWKARGRKVWGRPPQHTNMCLIGGSRRRMQIEVYTLQNHVDGVLTPWQLAEMKHSACVAPSDPALMADIAQAGIDFSSDEFDPAESGLRILELQRRPLPVAVTGGPQTVVGGFAQLTSLWVDGTISSRVAHHWPDRIGERIAA